MKKKQRQHDPCLITFEGIDGCGKTTQAMLAFRFLSGKGMKVKLLREPGSTKISILLNRKNSMSDITELLLYEAARSEIVSREIAPLLASGHIILCDRFYDSTTAYQGCAPNSSTAWSHNPKRSSIASVGDFWRSLARNGGA